MILTPLTQELEKCKWRLKTLSHKTENSGTRVLVSKGDAVTYENLSLLGSVDEQVSRYGGKGIYYKVTAGFPGGASGKESPCQCWRHKRRGFHPWVERSPGEGNGNPLQSSCLENSIGQRSLVGYSPWCCKESDTTEWLTLTFIVLMSINNLNLHWMLPKLQIKRGLLLSEHTESFYRQIECANPTSGFLLSFWF